MVQDRTTNRMPRNLYYFLLLLLLQWPFLLSVATPSAWAIIVPERHATQATENFSPSRTDQSRPTEIIAVINTPIENQSLNSGVSYISDKHQKWSFETIQQASNWIKNPADEVLNFGFTHDPYWLHVPLDLANPSHQQLNLVIPYPLLESVKVAIFDQDKKLVFQSNLVEQYKSARPEDFQSLLFSLPKALEGPVDLYLRVESTTSMQIPLEIWSDAYTQQRHSQGMLLWGLYFGVIVGLTLYNGFLFFSVRDITYCYYSLYLISTTGVMLCLSGLGNSYFWTMETTLSRHALTFFTGTMTLLALAFARAFLQGSRFPGLFNLALKASVVVCLALIVMAWFNPVLGAPLAAWNASLFMFLILAAGVFSLSRGLVIARYFVLAFVVFVAGTATYLLNTFGLLPVSTLTTHSIQLGSALEAILLSLALAHRIKEDRNATILALQQKHTADQQLKEIKLERMDAAMHDPITHYPNDSLLLAFLQEQTQNEGKSLPFGLVLLYIPQVRDIATSLGREIAEPFFRTFTQSLNGVLKASDKAFCIEEKTDAYLVVLEFGMVAFVCHGADNIEEHKGFIEGIQNHFEASADIGNLSVSPIFFFGIAHYPSHATQPAQLLQHATAALEYAQRNGKQISVYHSGIDTYGQRRLIIMAALSHAIKQTELELFAQPQVNSTDLSLVGTELLLRWNSAKLGNVPTQEFIEIAENAGMMKHITRFVVSRGMLFLKQLHQRHLPITVSVNLSIQNLVEPDFVTYIIDSAKALGVDLHYLVLEVTETSASENIGRVIDNLKRLAQAGCSIALDDFGTGYSSLEYLSRLPIHELKIDRSFISRMGTSDSHLRIVENTLTLAKALQIQTVAEGVEDETMLSTITQLGCNRVQGYHIGKPMPLPAFHHWAQKYCSQLQNTPNLPLANTGSHKTR
ncbi:Conserved hypothetical protein [gamma proteobacterium HdN1]|nr:Conserved hypothetical protein [gamma proteobacterium HdN1]